METIVPEAEIENSKLSLEVRVALLEQAYRTMHTDFRELRTTITNTAISVVGFLLMGLIAVIIYFGQQKDKALMELKDVIRTEQAGRN
jgi:hypothetical protein